MLHVDQESDLDFYTRRAGEELRAAAAAENAEARLRHRMLAENYAILVQEAASRSDGDPRPAAPAPPLPES